MEDLELGLFACFVPDKTKADLGLNGWNRYIENILTLSTDGDHLNMPMPGYVHLLHAQIEQVLTRYGSLA